MLALALVGWLAAVIFAALAFKQQSQASADASAGALTHLVMLDRAGVPESVRILTGAPPRDVTRAHGKAAASKYVRVGTAALYRAKG